MANFDYELNSLISYYHSLVTFADPLSKFNIVKSETDTLDTYHMLINIRQDIIDKRFTEAAKELMFRYEVLPYHLAHVRDILEFYIKNPNEIYNLEDNSSVSIDRQSDSLPIPHECSTKDINTFVIDQQFREQLDRQNTTLDLILEKLSSSVTQNEGLFKASLNTTLDKLATLNTLANTKISEIGNVNTSLANLSKMIDSLISAYDTQIKDISDSMLNHNQIVTIALSEVSRHIEMNQRKMLTDLLAHETKEFTFEAKNFINHYNSRFNAIEQYGNKVIKEAQTIAQNSILKDKTELFKQAQDTLDNEFDSAIKRLFIIAAITTIFCTIVFGGCTAYVTAKYTTQSFINTLHDLSNNHKSKTQKQ